MEILMRSTICFLLTFVLFTVGLFSVAAAQETDSDKLLLSDVNKDGVVNILDLAYVASQFGKMPTIDQSPNPDINSDGVVNILDLTLTASHFGKYSGIPMILTDKTFNDVVLRSELPILVEFKSDS